MSFVPVKRFESAVEPGGFPTSTRNRHEPKRIFKDHKTRRYALRKYGISKDRHLQCDGCTVFGRS